MTKTFYGNPVKTIVYDSMTAVGQYYMEFEKRKTMDREELLTVMNKWDLEELSTYIRQLEIRVEYNKGLLRDLRAIERRKKRRTTPENGVRDGR